MRKVILLVLCVQISLINYSQIIADHTIIDRFNDIPQHYIDEVKKMWLVHAGESHSAAIRTGLSLLESLDSKFQVTVTERGTPLAYTDNYLRVSRATWGDYSNSSGWIYTYGEEDWFTNSTAINRTKAGINYCNTNNLTIAAIGFGWCWDDTYGGPSATTDPVYGCRWYGSSKNGPNGNLPWGLDAGDNSITGNTVCMDTYLNATQQYIDYCTANSYSTQVFFTTGPVDTYYDTGEIGYQGSVKHQYIRDYVIKDPTRVLFDYADILCYDDNGVKTTATWNGHIFPRITSINGTPEQTGHISNAGAIRLAKAMWWMLARIAGWDGGTSGNIPVTSITVTGQGGATSITTDGGTLQMLATVLPSNATNKTVTWSITSGSSYATINSTTGLLTAADNGTVTVRATATDGSNVYGSTTITISGQIIPVTSITVTGQGGASSITTDGGTLQMIATVLPSNATNKTVTWSITSGSSYATINSTTGLLTAADNGTVTVRATATDGSNVYGSTIITISGQVIPVTSITVSGQGGATSITTDGGTLQMVATVLPSNATNKTVTWSITSGGSYAAINSNTGLLTAVDNGTVTVRATATDGSNVYGSTTITISGQIIPITSITVAGQGGATSITTDGGTLQMLATVLPSNATNKTVIWSITSGSSYATINSATGLLTAVDNGTVTVRATAADGSNVYGSTTITITNQTTPVVLITSITVSGQGGAASITTNGGTLQMVATVSPSNASSKTVTWSITSGSAYATINSTTGLLTAVDNGTVTVRATATDGSNVYGSTTITISGQVIPVTSITVSGQGGATSITTNGGTLQMVATVSPSNASSKTVTWSITSGGSYATINSSGLVTAVSNGMVTARATANDGSGVYGQVVITISNQVIPVNAITITSDGGTNTINTENGTLQLNADITPSYASDKSVSWSVANGTGEAEVSPDGVVTAISKGSVIVMATANDGSGALGILEIIVDYIEIPDFRIIVNQNFLDILFDGDQTGIKVSIYNFSGYLIQEKIINGNSCQFDIASFSKGFYIIVVSKSMIYRVEKVILS